MARAAFAGDGVRRSRAAGLGGQRAGDDPCLLPKQRQPIPRRLRERDRSWRSRRMHPEFRQFRPHSPGKCRGSVSCPHLGRVRPGNGGQHHCAPGRHGHQQSGNRGGSGRRASPDRGLQPRPRYSGCLPGSLQRSGGHPVVPQRTGRQQRYDHRRPHRSRLAPVRRPFPAVDRRNMGQRDNLHRLIGRHRQ